MTSSVWDRFVGRRRPLTPVTDRADCALAVAVVKDLLTGHMIVDPMEQAYLDFQATMIQEWEKDHDDAAMGATPGFSGGEGAEASASDGCRD